MSQQARARQGKVALARSYSSQRHLLVEGCSFSVTPHQEKASAEHCSVHFGGRLGKNTLATPKSWPSSTSHLLPLLDACALGPMFLCILCLSWWSALGGAVSRQSPGALCRLSAGPWHRTAGLCEAPTPASGAPLRMVIRQRGSRQLPVRFLRAVPCTSAEAAAPFGENGGPPCDPPGRASTVWCALSPGKRC